MPLVYHRPDYQKDHEYETIALKYGPWALEFTNQHGGTLFTALPVSSVEHRKKWKTQAALVRHSIEGSIHTLVISDDWGCHYSVQVDEAKQPEELKKMLGWVEELKMDSTPEEKA